MRLYSYHCLPSTGEVGGVSLLLLVQRQVDGYGDGNGSTYHGVVTDTQEAHHLNVSRNRRGTCELSVAVHTTHGVCHTVRGRTGSHIIGVQGTTRTTTGGYREVRLTGEGALLLVSTSYWVLEAGGVGRVTRDGHVHILMPQDGNTLADIVSTVALYLQTAGVVAVRYLTDNLQLRGEVVELCLHIGETVDTADDLCGILTQTVQDDTEGLLAHLVSHLGNLDGTLGSSEALVTSQEGEALSLLTQQTGSQVTMTQTYLTVVGNTTGDAEALQTDTDSLGSVSGSLHTLLNGNGGTANVCPLGVLKTDTLSVLTHLIGVNTCLITNLVGFLNTIDAILFQSCKNLVDTALLALKLYFSYHRNNFFQLILQFFNFSITSIIPYVGQ